MFVLSLKMSRSKIIGMLCICIAAVAIVFIGINTPVEKSSTVAVTYMGQTNEQRLQYIQSKGWQVSEDIKEIEIIVPEEFDNIYEKYNSLQKLQGFDLKKYKGKKVTRYTYVVTNYPTQQDSEINLNLIVYDNVIIGGDVCSTALGGFIHGLEMPTV